MFAFSQNESNRQKGTVVVWGTITNEDFTLLKNYLESEKEIPQSVEYLFIEPFEFDSKLTTALAEGVGPDVVLLTDNRLVIHENKLLQIDYEFFPERLFKDTFVEAGEIFTDENGIFGFPFLIDPMVMYWNRALFTEAGESQPPKYWDELLTLVPDLTVKDTNLAIEKSAIAMGDYENINHAKELFTTLLLQSGNDVVRRKTEEEGGRKYEILFANKLGFTVAPAQAAVNFYTQFSNPSRNVYSWNRSLPDSLDAFIAGDVAIYFGFASEFATVRQKNPNLNFDVAVIPQSRSGRSSTVGRVLSMAIPKTTPNVDRAYSFIQNMIEQDVVTLMSDVLFLPPVRRDLLAGNPGNAFMQTFHDSALLSENIYDFDPDETDEIFRNVIESVVSGRLTTSEAVTRAHNELQLLMP